MRRGLAILAVLALGACTGDDATTADTTADTTASTTPAPTTRASTTASAPTTSTTSSVAADSTAPPTTVGPASQPATSVATSVGATDEWCLRAAELNQLAGAFRELDATDRDAVEQGLAEILDRLDRIETVVPTQLADDLAVSAEAFRLLEAALSDVDYDMEAADFTQLDARRSAIVAANSRIRTFNHDECGLDAGVTGAEVP
jgi:hypothetical protein